jgi:hypothetical protein
MVTPKQNREIEFNSGRENVVEGYSGVTTRKPSIYGNPLYIQDNFVSYNNNQSFCKSPQPSDQLINDDHFSSL